jgi:GntR family transcriptional regulator/MocR family aminotransferase
MPGSRTSSGIELLVELNRTSATPLHNQLEHELRDAIRSGRLAAGTPLPSTRALAAELGLSRGVVVEAYEQLVAEGYLMSRPGGATSVSPSAVTPPETPPIEPPASLQITFHYGRPDVREFPRSAWLRSMRRALDTAPADRLSYLGGRGVPELREAMASYLNRVRGTAAHSGHVVICTGFAQGFALVAQVLKSRGARRLAVEDPTDESAPAIARSHGLEVVGIPLDSSGIQIDALRQADPDAVLVTPAHQFPTGAVLRPERRAALVSWAHQRNAVIVEDDYDAEFRYDRVPIGAIQGLASERVVYAGSTSKTLAPGIRLGWLLAPGSMVEALAAAKLAADRGSSSLDQLALADFVSHGELDRHLRRMRPIYRKRRDTLLAALRRKLPQLKPVGVSAGLHLLAWLPPGIDERLVIAEAASLGLGIDGLEPYRVERSDGPGGLIFGYAGANEQAIAEGVEILAQAVARATGASGS